MIRVLYKETTQFLQTMRRENTVNQGAAAMPSSPMTPSGTSAVSDVTSISHFNEHDLGKTIRENMRTEWFNLRCRNSDDFKNAVATTGAHGFSFSAILYFALAYQKAKGWA